MTESKQFQLLIMFPLFPWSQVLAPQSPVTSSTLRHSISAAGEGFADHRHCLGRSCFGDIHGVNIGSGVIEIGFVSIMFSSVLSNRRQKRMKVPVECWKHDLHCVANCHCL